MRKTKFLVVLLLKFEIIFVGRLKIDKVGRFHLQN